MLNGVVLRNRFPILPLLLPAADSLTVINTCNDLIKQLQYAGILALPSDPPAPVIDYTYSGDQEFYWTWGGMNPASWAIYDAGTFSADFSAFSIVPTGSVIGGNPFAGNLRVAKIVVGMGAINNWFRIVGLDENGSIVTAPSNVLGSTFPPSTGVGAREYSGG